MEWNGFKMVRMLQRFCADRRVCVLQVCVCPCCVLLPAAAVAALESLSFTPLYATPPLYLRMRGALFENKAVERREEEMKGEERRETTGVAGSKMLRFETIYIVEAVQNPNAHLFALVLTSASK